MLKILVPGKEEWDARNECFVYTKETTLVLEHSLLSISKWESKWHKPFLSETPKSYAETIDYIKCMTITQNVPDDIYRVIDDNTMKTIQEYIANPMTATTFSDKNQKGTKEIITAEILYYDMIQMNIPFECERWHLNRLLTLIRVCSVKNAPAKKMSKSEVLARNRSLNAQRRAAMNSRG